MKFRFKAARGASEEIELNNNRTEKGPEAVTHGLRFVSLQAFLSVCLVLALVGGSYAWFTNNRNNGQQITSITSDDLDFAMAEFHVVRANIQYLYDENDPARILNIKTDDKGMVLLDERIPFEDISGELISLNPYDSIFDNNRYSPVYIKVRLKGKKISEHARVLMTLTCSGNTVIDSDGMVATEMSNFMNVRTAQIAALNGVESPEGIFDGAADFDAWTVKDPGSAGAAGDGWTWLEYSGSGRSTAVTTAVKPAELTVDLGTGYTVTGEDNDEAVFFFELDYNEKLVQAYLNSRLGKKAGRLNQSDLVSVNGDITRINFTIAD